MQADYNKLIFNISNDFMRAARFLDYLTSQNERFKAVVINEITNKQIFQIKSCLDGKNMLGERVGSQASSLLLRQDFL
jgi:hypothetical protein